MNTKVQGYSYIDPSRAVPSRRLIVALDALQKHGKTRFALTAPGPIAYMDFDQRYEGTIEPFLKSGKPIAWATNGDGHPKPYQIPAEAGASDEESKKVQAAAKVEWRRFESDFTRILQSGEFRTIVVDLASEAWELLRLAAFGRLDKVPPVLYGEANGAFRRLIRLVRNQTRTSLILNHKLGKEYEEKADGKGGTRGIPTGRLERKGFGETGFLADVNLYLTRLPQESCAADDLGFRAIVTDCGMNARMRGLELQNEMIDFAVLASMLTEGETSPEDWR